MDLKILTYNVASGIGNDKVYDWERSCRVMQESAADLIALQEVAANRPGCPQVDYPERAAEKLNMYSAFARTLEFANGGRFGNMILSRWPVSVIEEFSYELPPEAEPRKALIVEVHAPEEFYFISTHLPYQGECDDDDALRQKCLQALCAKITASGYTPAILCGDLNNPVTAPALEYLQKSWTVTNLFNSGEPTAKTGKFGWMQIDFIACYPPESFKVASNTVLPDITASDHHPVLAELTLN